MITSYLIVFLRVLNDEDQKRIEGDYAKAKFMLKSIREDENLMQLFNMFPKLHVYLKKISLWNMKKRSS